MDPQDGYIVSYGTAKLIEFVLLFGLVFAFGFQQLRSLKRLERQREQAQAEAQARGEAPVEPRAHIPGWLARR